MVLDQQADLLDQISLINLIKDYDHIVAYSCKLGIHDLETDAEILQVFYLCRKCDARNQNLVIVSCNKCSQQ